jgi:hypothetical protein
MSCSPRHEKDPIFLRPSIVIHKETLTVSQVEPLHTMSVQSHVRHFEEWKSRYPVWQDLQTYLESEEGGYLRIVDQSDTACIIRYDKTYSRMDLPHVPWCRSVIWDKVRHLPVSVAPPKASAESCPHTNECQKGLSVASAMTAVADGRLSVEEYADGFMVQVYRIRGDPTPYIATRSKRDASGTFYSAKSFRTLFLEAYGSDPLVTGSENEERGAKADEEPVASFWSYVVQHPEHRVVTPYTIPRVHLVQRGWVSPNGTVTLRDGFPSLAMDPSMWSSALPLKEAIRTECQTRPWWFRGIVLKDTTGQRWRFRSEKYTAIRALRGGEANVYERYARIFTQNLSTTYFEYYPEDMIPFSLCGVFMNDIIHTLHRMYLLIHVRKSTTFAQIHRVYRPHLYALHGVYLTSLRPEKKWLTDQDIRVYLISQPPARIAFLIRQHQEEYHSRVAQAV